MGRDLARIRAHDRFRDILMFLQLMIACFEKKKGEIKEREKGKGGVCLMDLGPT